MADSRLRGRSSGTPTPDPSDNLTPPAPDLMEVLEGLFPVALAEGETMEALALDASFRHGQQSVMTFLRTLYRKDR